MTTSLLQLEKEIGRDQAIVVDSAMEIRSIVEWFRAVTLVVNEEAYTLIPRGNGEVVRSQKLSIPKPLVVVLHTYPHRFVKVVNDEDQASRSMILTRDNWTCQYCGSFGDTIDHIMPKSRGGKNTWGNLCCACTTCNGRKADSTPEEAGLRQPIIPSVSIPGRKRRLQETIYQEVAAMVA